jgi:hypothetical protein
MHPMDTCLYDLSLVYELKSIPPAPNIEDLRTYHMTEDQLNYMMFPDVEDKHWHVKIIGENLIFNRSDGSQPVYLKVQ